MFDVNHEYDEVAGMWRMTAYCPKCLETFIGRYEVDESSRKDLTDRARVISRSHRCRG